MKNARKNVLNKENKGTFQDMLDKVIFDIPGRSKEIIKSRYGISNDNPKTLEEIGKEYKITRERVRQIIKEALKKVKVKAESGSLEEAGRKIEFTINQNSGIIKENQLLDKLGGNDQKEKNAIKFILECIDGVDYKEEDEELEKVYFTKNFDFTEWKNVKSEAKKVLEKEKEGVVNDDFYGKYSKNVDSADRNKFFNFIDASREIKKNSFEKWGLAEWSDITPRVSWQRAYVILKETGKPLHFREITQLIDKHGLGKKKTHPQTIHNELIKNSQFVLVGRGVYALTEWGYRKGTVKDVLEEILKDNEQPMDRGEILNQILKIRQVKKSTILINLNNYFEKVGGKYKIKG